MVLLFFYVLGPVMAGIVLALVWWLIWGRKKGLPGGSAGTFSLAAGLLLVLGIVAVRLITSSLLFPLNLPVEFWYWHMDFRFTIPLLLGIVGLVVLAFPVRARPGRGMAELTPRTPLSFARGQWLVTPAVVLALILTATVATGAASQPDPSTGHYTMYFVDLGGEMGMGTNIYGWFNSVPCLILMGGLIVIAVFDLFLIARPALGQNLERDVHLRTVRSRNVLAVATGAFLLHFGLILGSVAGTSSIRSEFRTSEGNVSFWTTFAALGPTLTVASEIFAAVGFAFWATVALSAIPSRQPQPVTISS